MYEDGFYRPLNWFIVSVIISESGHRRFQVIDPKSIGARPDDANPCLGNPYTPWYQTEEHLDEEHVHIRAQDVHHAEARAKKLYREKYG